MKVVILADSLALPRGQGKGNVALELTYPSVLAESLQRRLGDRAPTIVGRGMVYRTMVDVLERWDDEVGSAQADVVVVHVGVVDCAPRVFLPKERAWIARLRPARLRKLVLRLVNRHRRRLIRLRPNRVYVPQEEFARAVKQVVDRAHECRLRSLILVNILFPPDYLEHRSPGFQRSVERYNKVLRAQADDPLVQLVDLNRVLWQAGPIGGGTVDGIHLDAKGHRFLACELESQLVRLIQEADAGPDCVLSTARQLEHVRKIS